jgi:hypothetical protein
MTGAIAIIGWGSLLWDLENLAPHVSGDWAIDRGPLLPLEFVRVSPKRLDALTVVVDRDHGATCATSFRLSRQSEVSEAVANLAARERAAPEHIGFLCLKSGRLRSRLPEIAERMAAWLDETGLDAAVWTDLAGNFRERTGRDFSIAAAIDYLSALPEASMTEARRYIASAPAAVDTPLRRALETHDWWRAVAN